MPQTDIAKTTTPTVITDYSIDSVSPDSPGAQQETIWPIKDFSKWFGNYTSISKIKKAIDAYSTWILGKGWEADSRVTVILEGITGWGEDTFDSIMWNALVIKKVGGDSFTEIIRDEEGEVINLKPLNPEFVSIHVSKKGIITKYSLSSSDRNKAVQVFKPNDILHLCNGRVTDEIHGRSDIEAVEWIVTAQEEAMRDYKKQLHRNGVARVIEVDSDDTAKINSLKAQWKEAIENGDVLIIPKGVAEAKDFGGNITDPIPWIKYLDNLFYMSIGVPRVILGGSEEFTEASSKIGYLTFEQIYLSEQKQLEADLWNQLAIRVKFNKPASLKNEMLSSEEKNTGQVGFQPTDTEATVGRVE